jgi:YD repeat-containing protein
LYGKPGSKPPATNVAAAYAREGQAAAHGTQRREQLVGQRDGRGQHVEQPRHVERPGPGWLDNNTTTFVVDGLHQVVQQIDPLGHTTTTCSDAAGRVSSITDGIGQQRLFTYDAAGRVTLETWKNSGGTLVSLITRTYDAAGKKLTAGKQPGYDHDGI